MEEFRLIEAGKIDDNFIRLIGNEWMLVTAGGKTAYNMMTASWGGVGFLWNKPVVFVFIRPQRYTFGFVEKQEAFTLSFFGNTCREALKICGTESGRDIDKTQKTGLTPWVTEAGNVAFQEARLVLECKKLYADSLSPEAFIEKQIPERDYPGNDFHKMYVAEIVKAWIRK